MFDLPHVAFLPYEQRRDSDIARFADWVEFCTLIPEAGSVSREDAADIVNDSMLLGNLPGDLYPRDESFDDETAFSPHDDTELLIAQVWRELRLRAEIQKPGYPLTVLEHRVDRRRRDWREVPGFAMLLVMDLSRFYDCETIVKPNTLVSRLFEKVVEASTQGLLGGTSVRFGVPIEAGWPTPIDDRIRKLGELLSLSVENLEGKTGPKDKDRGLDVVGRLSFGDDGPGTLFLLTQCATGKHWIKKSGEPSKKKWQNILNWNGELMRAIAVPWRLDEDTPPLTNYVRAHAHFDALILDRPRLVSGNPDRRLTSEAKGEIAAWCEEQIQKFPRLR